MNSLIARMKDMSQYDKNNSSVIWTLDSNGIKKFFSMDKVGFNAIFICTDRRVLTGKISEIDNDKVTFNISKEAKLTNDDLLRLPSMKGEYIPQVKASFKLFVHPIDIDIDQLNNEIDNPNLRINYYILADISALEQMKADLKSDDRVAVMSDGVFQSVRKYDGSELVDLDLPESNLFKAQGMTLEHMKSLLSKTAEGAKTTTKRHPKTMDKIRETLGDQKWYKFDSFNTYYDILYNKKVYGPNNERIKESPKTKNISDSIRKQKYPLNQILYGPPGTGKTYNTIKLAAQIVAQEFKDITDYAEAKKIFNNHIHKRIEFITFHQNYSYEDFIQGLRPNTDDDSGGLSFYKCDGVFFKICTNALFEYYKLYQQNTIGNKEAGLVYLDFVDYYRTIDLPYKIESKDAKVSIVSIRDDDTIELQHNELGQRFVVKKKLLLDLYSVYPATEDIKNVQRDIRKEIGGKNATVYWAVLNEFIKFHSQFQSKEHNTPDMLDKLDYDEKKKRLKAIGLEKIREGTREKENENDVPKYVIIIDEINRANISRVFGELITLIEEDKRSHGDNYLSCTLPSGDELIVPSNLYLIGTMNTADKSLALLDVALRRRFRFEPIYPKYVRDGVDVKESDRLEKINKEIISMMGVKGHDHQIGHSYFMGGENFNILDTMNDKVIPLLMEYFMNDPKPINDILVKAGFKVVEGQWPIKITQ